MSFVALDIQTDSGTLQSTGINSLTASFEAQGITGWIANDGNLEIILLGAFADLMVDLVTVGAEVPSAIFRVFGTTLANIPYETGAAAMVATTWTLSDVLGHTIPAGTYVTIADLAFQALADVVVAPGASSASVLLVAGDIGTDYNSLTGPIAVVDNIDWVASVAIIGSTSGGVDPETDLDYQNRLAGQLALQAPRPITASDYGTFTLSVPSTVLPSGVVVGRASSIDGYNPAGATFTGTTTSASATMTAVSSFVNIVVGSVITGTNIPAYTTVVSTNSGASTLVMSNAATGAGTASTITVGTFNNPRYVTVFATDAQGNALSGTAMTAIQTWLGGYRELNFMPVVQAPIYTTIYVTYRAQCLPGVDAGTLQTTINTVLAQYLSPATWGNRSVSVGEGGGTFLNGQQGFATVRYNKVIGVIENVNGVDYVYPGSTGLAIGTTATPTGTSDITLGGPAPLPTAGTITATVVGG